MKKKRRLFVVSDIHGHYTLMKKALDDAGFDETNEEHLLICCGDLFDRGRENRKVYDYMRGLKHKILICGNHDERLSAIIKDGRAEYYDLKNGAEVTLEEFFGPGSVDNCGRLLLSQRKELAEELCQFIDSMVDYYETEHYVFTHGWVPLNREGSLSSIRDDWRTADAAAWHHARYAEWYLLSHQSAKIPGKTIVCGHRPTRFACIFDPNRKPTDSDIFYGEGTNGGVIAIDAGTVRSGRVNVLVLEEEI